MVRINDFCETIAGVEAPKIQMNAALHSDSALDLDALRDEALLAGAIDPTGLRFRVVEFDKHSGKLLGVPIEDVGFSDGIARTARLIESRFDSHFCLEPVGFLQ
jgi:hypothetical protein